MTCQVPAEFAAFADPHRFKIAYGGRAGMRSWSVAQLLLVLGLQTKRLIGCFREYQSSIRDSAHRLLSDQITRLGLDEYYTIQRDVIRGSNGTEFVFRGLHHNSQEIKSTEGIDIAWVEEAENVSAESWDVLIPTIRKPGSEIWASFNPADEESPTYRRFVIKGQADQVTVYTTYLDTHRHGWLPKEIYNQAEHDKEHDPDRYEWIWLGQPRKISNARIFTGKYRVAEFDTPEGARFFHGADWGFAQDPTVVVRTFVIGNTLYVDQESFGVGVEMQELPALFDRVPTAKKWPIPADSARPETIAWMQRQGYDVYGAEKWAGSIEDGIEYLRSFDEILIHPRCERTAEEARLYSYKVDRRSGEVLPVVMDAHNHCWDAIRYAHVNEIRNKSDSVVEWIDGVA